MHIQLTVPQSGAYSSVSKERSQVQKVQLYNSLRSGLTKITHQFSLPVDPAQLGTNEPEPDDALHQPDPKRDRLNDVGTMMTLRGLVNLGCIAILFLGIVALL